MVPLFQQRKRHHMQHFGSIHTYRLDRIKPEFYRKVAMTRSEITKNVYVRLAVAARTGKGIRLTAEDCRDLGGDDPIITAAYVAAEEAGFDIDASGKLVPHSNAK